VFGSDETAIARNVAVTVGTTRLESTDALKARRYFNGVQFETGAAGSARGKWGFQLPDGTLVKPEAEAVDRAGAHHALRDVSSGNSGGRYFFTLYSRDLPKESEFVAVLVMTDIAFRTPEIAWVSWDRSRR
jgi:hypothetical protein